MNPREKRILIFGVPVILFILIWKFGFSGGPATPATVLASESVPMAEKRLAKLRLIAATVPGKQQALAKVDSDLALREKGIIQADTAPQAQARLLEIISRVAKAEGIDARGGELGPPKLFGLDYGEVTAAVTFVCPIEKFVNFMAGLSHEPELIGPTEIHMNAQNPKEKTLVVRMTLGGIVAKKLVPEKKGYAAF